MVAKIRRYMISTTTLFCRKQKWSLTPSQNTIHNKTPKTETREALNRKTKTEQTLNKIPAIMNNTNTHTNTILTIKHKTRKT